MLSVDLSLDPRAIEEIVAERCSAFGMVLKVRIVRTEQGQIAFIEMASPRGLDKLLDNFEGRKSQGLAIVKLAPMEASAPSRFHERAKHPSRK